MGIGRFEVHVDVMLDFVKWIVDSSMSGIVGCGQSRSENEGGSMKVESDAMLAVGIC